VVYTVLVYDQLMKNAIEKYLRARARDLNSSSRPQKTIK
jgi:hypothetical protein